MFCVQTCRKEQHERPKRRGEDIIKVSFRKYYVGMDWIDVMQDRGRWRASVDAVMNLRVP
jgi:hypothetical protein